MSLSENGMSMKAYAGVAGADVGYFVPRIENNHIKVF